MQTIIDLWNGNIAPCEVCGSNDTEINDLLGLMKRNRESLCDTLTAPQKDAFQKYMDCTEEYLLRMLELAFRDGFCLASRLLTESLNS
ncbi:MAG: hypothetical protein IJX69_06310 [Oscillospiraceae bacterium]|nr:hypothetical protein [Oscillospiraceae bacterium]